MRHREAALGGWLRVPRALWLALLACGCVTSPGVLRPADEAFAQGDMREASRRYQRIIDERWLTRAEFERRCQRRWSC
jgi:hypothetical protein